jgi:hypothetical protein
MGIYLFGRQACLSLLSDLAGVNVFQFRNPAIGDFTTSGTPVFYHWGISSSGDSESTVQGRFSAN